MPRKATTMSANGFSSDGVEDQGGSDVGNKSADLGRVGDVSLGVGLLHQLLDEVLLHVLPAVIATPYSTSKSGLLAS